MAVSFIRRFKNIYYMKAIKFGAIIAFFFITIGSTFSQVPVWTATYPSVNSITALNGNLKVNLTSLPGNVTVYYTVYTIIAGDTPAGVKASSSLPPSGAFRGGGSFIYATGDAGITINRLFENLLPNKPNCTILVTVEYSPGVFLPVKSVVFATPACPNITPATALTGDERCVNIGAIQTYEIFPSAGILKGAQWEIKWGDSSIDTYMSSANGDVPSPFLSHQYLRDDSCYYKVTLKINNIGVCSTIGLLSKNEYAKVHGRDDAADGLGSQLLVNLADGSPDTIKICAGNEKLITLQDAGVWDCDGDFKIYPPGEVNANDRNVQYVYGMHPFTQAVAGQNTITGSVTITGTYSGTATLAAGFATGIINIPTATMSPIINPNTQSGVIKIPATAQYKEKFHVYFKNWNKCNPYLGAASMWDGSAVWDSIVIYIIKSPPAPTVPDKVYCSTDTPTLTVTSTPVGGKFTWYKNANKTSQVATGVSYTPSIATDPGFLNPGVNVYYVADGPVSGPGCEGPVRMVTLTIHPIIATNTVGNAQTICYNTVPTGLTGSTPTGGAGAGSYSYQWQRSTDNFAADINNIGGATAIDYSPPALLVSTWYRRIVTSGPCLNISNIIKITVTPLNTAGAPSTTPTLCINTALTAITIATTGATGISNDAVSGANGLPAGVSAHWTAAAGGTITITGTPTASGTFNYSIPLSGGCGTVNATGTITVTPIMTATAGSSTPTLCISTALTAITHTTVRATGITNDAVSGANGLPAGVSAHWTAAAGGTITITGTPTASGTFNYSIPLAGGCGAINATGTITVTPNMTATAGSSNPTLCISTALTAITHTTTLATGITNDAVAGANGLPAGVSAHWTAAAGGTITITGTPTASGTFNYSIPLAGGCGAINATGTITVTPNMTATAGSSTPTLCISTALTAITHTTTLATGITNDAVAGANGLPAGVSAHWTATAGGTITITGTPTASGTFNYSIPLAGGCGTVNATGTITVTPIMTATAGSSTPTLCISTALTAITHTTVRATGISNDAVSGANGLPAGVSAHWTAAAGGTITITGTPTASGTFNYSIPLAGGCGAVNATGTITVTPNMTATAGSSTPTLCISTALTAITHTTTLATGITNDAVSGANGLPAGVSAHWTAAAGGTITITGTPTASGTFNYSIPLAGGCGAVNATGTITVTPNMTATAGSSTPTLCISTALTAITHTTTLATGITNDAVSGANGLPAGVSAHWTAAAGGTITITGTPTASGTFNYSIPLAGGCGAVNATGTITVNPAPNLIITNPAAVCSPATVDITAPAVTAGSSGGVALTYWNDAGATIACATPSAINVSGTYYIKYATAVPCFVIKPVVVSINPGKPAIPSITVGTSPVCKSAVGIVYGVVNDPTASTYLWSFDAGLSFTPTSPVNLNSITGNFAPASVSGNVTVTASNGCGTNGASAPYSITITPDMTATAGSSTPTLCISTALTAITHTTTLATGITNDAVAGANGLPAGVSAHWTATAGGTITITGTPTASGTFNYSIPLAGGCGAVNATGTITVTPNMTATAGSSTPTLCISTALTAITHTTTLATGITNDAVSGANGLPAGVSAHWTAAAGGTITITGTPTASGTFNYSIPLAGGCGAVNATGTITVTPNMTATAGSSTPTLCISTALTAITHTTTLATGITNDAVSGANGLPAGVSAHWTAAAGGTITITGTPTASGTFNYSIPLAGGCGAINATGTITVTPNMTATAGSSTPTLCISTALTAITHTTTLATGITNDAVSGANGLPAGVSAHWTAAAGGTITITGTPTASGTFNYSIPLAGGCGAINATGTITVTPNMTATAGSSTPTLCISTALTAITHTTTLATGITNDAVSGANGLPAGVSAHWTAAAGGTITITGTPTASGTFNYSIPLAGGCGAVNATGTITVTPNMTATAGSSTPTLCISTALTAITHTTTLATGITNDAVSGANGLPSGVSAHWTAAAGGTITITGTPTASGTFNYSIPLSGGCGTVNATGTITVTPIMTATAGSSTPTLCISTALTAITHTTVRATGITNDAVSGANGLPAGVSAHWTAAAGGTITITGTPTASGTFNYSIPLAGGCGAINATGTITVTPNMTATAGSSTPTLCISTALTAITHTTTLATGITNDAVSGANGLPAGVSAHWTAAAGGTITITGTPTASGTFNYSIPLAGGCGTVNATGTITVTPIMTATAGSSTPTLCISTALTAITHTTTLATGITNDAVSGANGLPAGVSAHWTAAAGGTITITGTPTASGTFNYSIPLAGGCGAINATGTITVTPNMTATAGSSTPTLCISTALTAITHTTTLATGITNDAVAGANGLPAGVSAHWTATAGGTITITGTPTASGTFNYSIPLAGGCGAVNATGTITVTPNMTATAGSSTPTLCISTALTAITHTTTLATGITNDAVSGANGLPAGVSAHWTAAAGGTITITGTPTASGTFNYSIPLAGGCGAINATGTITVTPNMTATAGSSTPTLCISTALTAITHTTTLATGITNDAVSGANGLPAGVSAHWTAAAGGTITITGTPTASGTF